MARHRETLTEKVPEILHQGFKISFSENEEVWRCWELNIENKSLAKLRTAINKHIKKVMDNIGIPMGLLSDYSSREVQRCTIQSRDAQTGEFWVVKEGETRRSREKLKDLIEWKPEFDTYFAEVGKIKTEIEVLRDKINAIPKPFRRRTPEQEETFLKDLLLRVKDEAVD